MSFELLRKKKSDFLKCHIKKGRARVEQSLLAVKKRFQRLVQDNVFPTGFTSYADIAHSFQDLHFSFSINFIVPLENINQIINIFQQQLLLFNSLYIHN